KIYIVLLAALDSHQETLAGLALKAAGIGVETVLGIYQVVVVLGQPVGPVILAAFFIGSQGQYQVSRGRPAFLFQADEIGYKNCVAVFDVHGATPIEVAINLIELERVHGPVLAQRLDHIQVADEQNGLALAASPETNYKIAFVGRGA